MPLLCVREPRPRLLGKVQSSGFQLTTKNFDLRNRHGQAGVTQFAGCTGQWGQTMSATSIGEQISDAAMIAMDGVGRILAKMHDAPKIDLGRLEKIDRQLLLYELQQCERKYLRLRNPSLHLTRPGLKRLKDLRGLLHDPKLPWRLLGVDDAIGTLTSKLHAFLAGPLTPLDANPKELLVGQDLAFVYRKFLGARPRLSRNPRKYKVYDTPFFVFIRAVQLEMEIEPSPNGTIARYLDDRGHRRVNRNY
jgi:hypothetical protein